MDDADPGTARGLAVAARPTTGASELLLERMSAPGYDALRLVGAVDLDADGATEVVLSESSPAGARYVILSHRAGRAVTAFRGGGLTC